MAFLEIVIQTRLDDFTVDFICQSDAQAIALFGPSGAGKTTLANAVAGLLTPQDGRIVVGGTVLFDAQQGINLPPQMRRIGYVFQDGRLFPHMRVQQNLLYPQQWLNKPSSTPRFEDVVELLDLSKVLTRYPGTLSGGERQRVAIGRALMSAPRLLLLDEPLSALDEARKQEILLYLQRLRQSRWVPMITISHQRSEIMRVAEEVVMIEQGRCSAQLSIAAFAAA